MGATPTPAGVRFKVWAPAASRVEVELTDSGQLRPLVSEGGGVWSANTIAMDMTRAISEIHIMAAPTTYTVNGEQYVAVQAGYGGAAITVGTIPPSSAAAKSP